MLDSTSDFVDAPERRANMRVVPLYVLFDGEPLRDQVDISSEQFTSAWRASSTLPTTSSPRPRTSWPCYEELRAPGTRASGRCTSPSKLPAPTSRPPGRRGARRRRGSRRRHGDGSSRPRSSRGDRPPARARLDRRVRWRSSSSGSPRTTGSSSRWGPRVPPEGRPDRKGQALAARFSTSSRSSSRTAWSSRSAAARAGRRRQGVRAALHRRHRDREGSGSAIAHANAPNGSAS